MAPASTIGRYPLSTRFTANVKVIFVDYPSQEELANIYQEFSAAILSQPQYKLSRDTAVATGKKLAQLLVEFYTQIK